MPGCDEYWELISARLDGALSPEEEARLEAHLASCPDCRAAEEELSAIHRGLEALPPIEPPAGLTERIMAAVEADAVVPLPVKKRAPWRKWLASAAVLAVILGGTAVLRPWQALNASGHSSDSTASAAEMAPAMAEDTERAAAGGETPSEYSEAGVLSAEDTAAGAEPSAAAVSEKAVPPSGPASSALSSSPEEAAPEEYFAPFSASSAPASPDGGSSGSAGKADGTPAPQNSQFTAGQEPQTSVTPREALELAAASLPESSDGTAEYSDTDGVLFCTVRMAGEEGDRQTCTVTYDGLSSDGAYYLFSLSRESQSKEPDEPSRCAVSTDGASVIWEGDASDSGGIFPASPAQ